MTPAKAGLIAVLAIVLLVVVGYQFLGEWQPAATNRRKLVAAGQTREEPVAHDTPTAAAGTDGIPPAKRWVEISREIALLQDPFGLPDAFAEIPISEVADNQATPARPQATRPDETHRLLRALQSQGVAMVLSTPQGMMATIGSNTFRVGDRVGNLRVADISPRGIVLVEADPPVESQPTTAP
jgi:hypothetical protein